MSGAAAERDPGLAEVREEWLAASDGLLAGLGHALNNRVAALSAVGQVLEATTEGPLSNALTAEAARLQRTVELLRLLVRRWAGEPEPVRLADVLADAAELLSHHPDLRTPGVRVDAQQDLPPVLGERSSLVHAFCLMLIPAARAAERAGEAALVVRCTGSDGEVRVEIPFPAGADHDGAPASALDPRAARGLVARAGGELSAREEGGALGSLEVRLPTLAEARRRQREGSLPAPGGPG